VVALSARRCPDRLPSTGARTCSSTTATSVPSTTTYDGACLEPVCHA